MNLWNSIKHYYLLIWGTSYGKPKSNYTTVDYNMFLDKTNWDEPDPDTSTWDISEVSDLTGVFSGCARLTIVPSAWDFSKVSMLRTIHLDKFSGSSDSVNRYIQLLIELGVHNNHFPDFIWSKYDVGSGSSKFDKFLDKERVDLGQVLLSVDLTLTDFFVLNNQAFFLLTPSDKPTLN